MLTEKEMVKVVLVIGPTTLPPWMFMFVLMVLILCYIIVVNIHAWFIHTNTGPILHNILGGRIISLIPHFFVRDKHDAGFSSSWNMRTPATMSSYFEVDIKIMLMVIFHLVLVMEMVNVVWVLGPPTLHPKMLIVVLIILILWLFIVCIIHTWIVHTHTGPIIHRIWGGRIIMFLLVMVEVVLFLLPPTSPPKTIIFSETGMR